MRLPALRSSKPFEVPDLTGVKILVVDDDDEAREILRVFLRACGSVVAVADGVDNALHFLGTGMFDILVSDLAMPGQDGLHLIRTVRHSARRYAAIPAIALTGFPQQYRRATEEGFDVELSKPTNLEVLARAIRAQLRKSQPTS